MKYLIPLLLFTACISFDQLKPVKSDKPGVVYLTGYSDTLRIDTLQLDGDKIYIKLKEEMKKELRIKVWKKYDKHCAYCGDEIEYEDMQVDHIIPQRNFFGVVRQYQLNGYKRQLPDFLTHLDITDVDHIDNLNPSCRKCNIFKDARDLDLFKSELQEQLKRANEYSTNYRFAKKYGQVVETPKPIIFYFEKKG